MFSQATRDTQESSSSIVPNCHSVSFHTPTRASGCSELLGKCRDLFVHFEDDGTSVGLSRSKFHKKQSSFSTMFFVNIKIMGTKYVLIVN